MTGGSERVGTGYDYAPRSSDGDGDQIWVARYNDPANARDEALASVIDGEANVYVTGHSVGTGFGFDYATIKYAQQEWGRGGRAV